MQILCYFLNKFSILENQPACDPQISYKMIVTPAQAGVQFKDAWIPACAGMTDSYHTSELNNILGNSSGTQHLKLFQKHF